MSTGEQFTIDHQRNEERLLCKLHFGIISEGKFLFNLFLNLVDLIDNVYVFLGDSQDSSSNDSILSSSVKPSKTKRVRTTFTEEQLQILQANFQVSNFFITFLYNFEIVT